MPWLTVDRMMPDGGLMPRQASGSGIAVYRSWTSLPSGISR
jgi:hypothetical protein